MIELEQITTEKVHGRAPGTDSRWMAYRGEFDVLFGRVGFGETESAAIQDLKRQEKED